jgi:alpha-aminoadipate carrier protein LysW
MVYCPECETDLDIEEDEVDEGEVVACPECGSEFEVTTTNPIELKPVDEEDEYEEDEEDDEDSEEESVDGDYS